MSELKKVGRVQDYISKVKWIVNLYEENEGIIHGFQKEAIQNSTGARKSSNYKDWKCEISVVTTDKGTFLIVEDFGTYGLTGTNYTSEELKAMVKNRELVNKPEERLARISCDNVSGGDIQSAGLFGVGKTMYIAASQDYTYYFESITDNEGYRCNINEEDQMFDRALEEDEGRDFIIKNTGLEPIKHVGTRFIILNPREDVVDSIIGEGQPIIKCIQETWWRVIRRLPPESGIFVQGTKAKVPAEYDFSEEQTIFEKDTYFCNDPADVEAGYRIKKFGFFIREKMPDYLSGFYYYRRGMKICSFNLKELEPHIPCNFVGFIEVEQDWEEELSKIENSTHYGIIKSAKNSNVFQYLQRAVKDNIEYCLRDWGYLKDETNSNKELRELVDSIKEDVIETLAENGYENIEKGDRRAPFEVRLGNVVYPHENEKKYERTVYTNEKISFDYVITNRTLRANKYGVRISVKSADGSLNTVIDQKTIQIQSGDQALDSVELIVNNENALQNSRNTLILSVFNANGTGKVVEKKLPFYYGIETDIRPEEDFKLDIYRHDFPRVSDRRVNTGESIQNVQYSIQNNLNKHIRFFVAVRSLNAENNNEKIEDISRKEYIVPPFGEVFITDPINICFSRDVYLPKLKKGIVEIRATLILGENLIEKQMGKTMKIDDYTFKVFFNKPEKSGLDFPYDLRDSDKHLRSWSEGHTIVINTLHPEYLQCKDILQKSRYIALQYLKQVVVIYAKEGTLDKQLLNTDSETVNSEYYDNLENIIEDLWYKQCQK